jgi:hypothetical protein
MRAEAPDATDPRYMPLVLNAHVAAPPRDSAITPPAPPTAPTIGYSLAEQPDAGADLVGDAQPDEILARSGRRHRRGTVVGVSSGADQRRIADPAPVFAGDPAGRGRGGNVAAGIARDCADGPVFHRPVEGRAGFGELARTLGRPEPRGVDLLESGRQCEGIRADAGEHDMWGVCHHRPGEADGVAGAGDAGNRSGAALAAVHDRGVEFDGAVGGEDRAAAGVELGRILEASHRRLDRVECAAARRQHRGSGIERGGERGTGGGIGLG